jgi:hypothetical protein
MKIHAQAELDGRTVNLGELRGLLLWIYFIGIPSTWSDSGKPGWLTDGGDGL